MGRKTSRGSNAWEHMRISKVTSQMARRSPLASSSGDAVFRSDGEVSTPPHPIYHRAPSTSPICTALNQIPNQPHPPPSQDTLYRHRTADYACAPPNTITMTSFLTPSTMATPCADLFVSKHHATLRVGQAKRASPPFSCPTEYAVGGAGVALSVLSGQFGTAGWLGVSCGFWSRFERSWELKHLFFPPSSLWIYVWLEPSGIAALRPLRIYVSLNVKRQARPWRVHLSVGRERQGRVTSDR